MGDQHRASTYVGSLTEPNVARNAYARRQRHKVIQHSVVADGAAHMNLRMGSDPYVSGNHGARADDRARADLHRVADPRSRMLEGGVLPWAPQVQRMNDACAPSR